LQQFNATCNGLQVLVLCHRQVRALHIKQEFDRLAKYLPNIRISIGCGCTPLSQDQHLLSNSSLHVLIGTPGKVLAMLRAQATCCDRIRHMVVDECDRCLRDLDGRKDIQSIFAEIPAQKQTMMFASETLDEDTRRLCLRLMQDPYEVAGTGTDAVVALQGLAQYVMKVEELDKTRRLTDLLDEIDFNQVIIFVRSSHRALMLDGFLSENRYPSIAIHPGLSQEERVSRYMRFKDFEKRILVATELFTQGIGIDRVNLVINYDVPEDSDCYLRRVGRHKCPGKNDFAITFVSSIEEEVILRKVEDRFGLSLQLQALPTQCQLR